MKITNVSVWGIGDTAAAARYPMCKDGLSEKDFQNIAVNFEANKFFNSLEDIFEPEPDYNIGTKDFNRLVHLGTAVGGSGHDCCMKGIVVQFDCNAPRYWWNQLQRYHFIDFVSSCSQMHRIGKLDLETNPDMFPETIEYTKKVVERFNNKEITIDQCLANVPQGIELTARLVTNYLQLKTIYNQRRTHRSRHWQEFCDWVETLPYARDFIIPGKGDKE